MAFSVKDNIWKIAFNDYHRKNDSLVDQTGRGITQRFVETLFAYWDNQTLPLVENLVENLVLPTTVLPELLTYLEDSLGINLIIDSSLPNRRNIAKYWYDLCQTRSTPLGIEATVRLMVFPSLKIYTVETLPFYNYPLPYAAKNAYFEYEIRITGSLMAITPNIVRSFQGIADWHEPINWKMLPTGIVYNDNYLPKDFVEFYFDDAPPEIRANRSHHLFVNRTASETFEASFTEQGHLYLEGEWAENYLFDYLYGRRQGRMLFRFPSPDYWQPFEVDNASNVGKNQFRITWNSVAGAVSYSVVVGRQTRASLTYTLEETAIDDKVLDFAAATSPYVVTGLAEQTVYFYQVWATDANGKKTHSDIKWVLTQRTVAAPTALPAEQAYFAVFTALWQSVALATGYRLDVASDAGFTSLVVDNLLIDQPVTRWRVVVPSTGTYYYRVRAIHHKIEGSRCIESPSTNSNVISVVCQYYDFGTDFNPIDFSAPL